MLTREFRTRQLQRFADSALTLRLYANDITPTGEETTAAFEEVRGGGYAPIPLDPASWTVRAHPPTASADPAPSAQTPTATYPRATFAFTGAAGLVHGYYVTHEGLVVEAQRFPDGPYEIRRDGEDIKVSLTIQG